MKTEYRGYKLEARRERALGGWSNLYYSAYPIDPDKPVLADDFTEGADTPKTYIGILKARVDDYYEHPEYYQDEAVEDYQDEGVEL